ncbi:MAG: hypothetical protein ABW352_23460 [Polyangiales bacterium]
MANRQAEHTKKRDGQQARQRQEPMVETVWESFPVIEPSERDPLPFDGRKTERDFEN